MHPTVLLAALIAGSVPSIVYAQADFIAPNARLPITSLPSCVDRHVVGACFDFDSGTLDNWQVADWATGSDDYVHGTVDISSDHAARSGRSLRLQAKFQSVGWSTVALELRADVSLADYASVRADVHSSADSTLHLVVRFVIVAGPSWDWFETKEPLPLDPGNWSVARAPLEADAWNGPGYPEATEARQWIASMRDVHKIMLRFEATPDRAGAGPADLTTISIDNIWFPESGSR